MFIDYERKFHLVMCLIGGVWGAYTILLFENTMAAAITTNLAVMVVEILKVNLTQFLLRAGVVVCYLVGLAIPTFFQYRIVKADIHRTTMLFTLLCSVATVLIPENAPNLVRMYPLFLGSGCIYNGSLGYGGVNVAPIFATNNSRQFVDRFLKYKYTGDPEMKYKAIIYITCNVFIIMGIVLEFFIYKLLGTYSVLFAAVLLIPALIFQLKFEKSPIAGKKF